MSVNGAEEDGVDNRVGAPAWVPKEGSDSETQSQEVSDTASQSTEPANDPASVSTPSGNGQEAQVKNGVTAAATEPTARGEHVEPNTANLPLSANPPLPGDSAPPPGSVFARPSGPSTTTPLPSAVNAAAGAAADAARGLAARVSSLSKPKVKTPTPPRRPPGNGQPPRPAGARPHARLTPGQPISPQARRAQLRIDRIEPWSVMKFSFLISLVGWVILFVAVSILYFALSKLGVFTSVEHTVGQVTSSKSNPTGSNAASWFAASRILGYTMLVGAVNVVLITALATIGAVLYNLVTMLAGGIEVTLKESD